MTMNAETIHAELARLERVRQAAQCALDFLREAPIQELEAVEAAIQMNAPIIELQQALERTSDERLVLIPLPESDVANAHSLITRGGDEIQAYLAEGNPIVDGYTAEEAANLHTLAERSAPLAAAVNTALGFHQRRD